MAGVYRLSGVPDVHLFTQVSGGTTATFKAGDLVTVHATSGDLILATAGVITGIALANAPGNTTTLVPVDVVSADDSEFGCKYSTTTAATFGGKKANFTFTSEAVVLTVNGSGTDAVIMGLDGRDATGTSGGRVIFRFKSSGISGIVGQ